MIAFYHQLLQEQGIALLVFNIVTIGLLVAGIAFMVKYEISEEELPDNLIYALMILGLFVTVLEPPTRSSMLESMVGLVAIGLMFLWVRLLAVWLTGESSIGFKEVKFAATSGLWVGFAGIVPLLLTSFVLAIVAFTVTYALRRSRQLPQLYAFPFSPVLGIATVIVVVLSAFGSF